MIEHIYVARLSLSIHIYNYVALICNLATFQTIDQ